MINSVLVYCGSSSGNKKIYQEEASKMGQAIASKKWQLIYGGGNLGLMGIVSNSVLEAGGNVCGIIPEHLSTIERVHHSLSDLIVVNSMHERKNLMIEKADSIIALPGGYGTLDELFEALCWSQLALHQKPVGLLNINNYFDPIIQMMDKMVSEGFLKAQNRELICVDKTVEGLIEKLEAYIWKGEEKWIIKEEN